MKTITAIALFSIFASMQAQSTGPPPFLGLPPAEFFQQIILQLDASRLLTKAGLPEDLSQRVIDTLQKAKIGFDECENVATFFPWIEIRCAAHQLKLAKIELKAIEDEARRRAAAAKTTALPNTTESVTVMEQV